jgi:3D (Asp-Asp-Asp) domain-containing protein
MKMTITKTLTVVFLIFLPTIALLGYLGHLYPPYVPIKATSGFSNGQTPEIVADIPLNPVQGEYRVTAYCQESCCCGEFADGITASGHVIQQGDRFVAAPKDIPFGTEFVIPGYNNNKPVKVLDRGGAIKGRRLDVFFDDANGVSGHQRALNWGVKYLEIKL